jgi:hypothetical protein
MADNTELQTSRIIGTGAGSAVDNNFRDVEAAIRKIFGITADTDYSEAMQILTGPNATMTGTLTLAGDPTDDLHACTKQYVDNNTGVAATVRCSLVLSSGQNVLEGDDDALRWDVANIEFGGECWNIGNAARLVFPSSGHYLITGAVIGETIVDYPNFVVGMKANEETWLYNNLGYGHAKKLKASVSFAVMELMGKDDYIEVFVNSIINNLIVHATTYVSMMKVGG